MRSGERAKTLTFLWCLPAPGVGRAEGPEPPSQLRALTIADGVGARAVVDQSPADGSWAAYAVKGDRNAHAVHRLEAADNELAAKAPALDAAWALVEPTCSTPTPDGINEGQPQDSVEIR